MPKRNINFDMACSLRCNKHSSKEDNPALCKLETPASDPMLCYYLEEGQPDFTNRLVHGQPVAKETRIKTLETIMKRIEHTLGKSDSAQRANLSGATDTIAFLDEAKAVQEDRRKEG